MNPPRKNFLTTTKASVTMTDNRTSEPTMAQVEAAARKWIERLDSDAHWARSPGAREKASSEKKILEWLLEAAAGVAPPAPSEYAYCPIHGDLLAANRSYRCGNAPTGHEYAAPVQALSTVDEAALIREAKAEARGEALIDAVQAHRKLHETYGSTSVCN